MQFQIRSEEWTANMFKYNNFMYSEPKIDIIANEYKNLDSHSR